MRTRRPSWTVCRAVLAVAALYALALQAMLGGMPFLAAADPAHALCAPGAGTQDGPAKSHQGHALPCCTLAQLPVSASPPVLPAMPVLWPDSRTVPVRWAPAEVAALPRAPPGISASPRAPPVV